jgi:NitT/TauT family transport system permease protein
MRYLPLLILALVWEAATRLNLVSALALPPLSHVAAAWLDLARDGELVENGLISIYRGVVGSVIRRCRRGHIGCGDGRVGGRSICF